MRQYVLYSGTVHLFFLAGLFFILRNGAVKAPKQYYIDFIGETRVETVQNIPGQDSKPAENKETAKTKVSSKNDSFEKDDFFKDSDLPKPSMASAESSILAQAQKESAVAALQGQNGGGINTDSNFPYPWYITQIREILWDSWRKRMPNSPGMRCSVKFTIARNGSVYGAGVEKSSGNRLFDYSAVSSVENAEKFPALPDDFFEDRLTVHVEFKSS